MTHPCKWGFRKVWDGVRVFDASAFTVDLPFLGDPSRPFRISRTSKVDARFSRNGVKFQAPLDRIQSPPCLANGLVPIVKVTPSRKSVNCFPSTFDIPGGSKYASLKEIAAVTTRFTLSIRIGVFRRSPCWHQNRCSKQDSLTSIPIAVNGLQMKSKTLFWGKCVGQGRDSRQR